MHSVKCCESTGKVKLRNSATFYTAMGIAQNDFWAQNCDTLSASATQKKRKNKKTTKKKPLPFYIIVISFIFQ